MDQVKVGRFIAQLRQARGWTQEELGERVGVTNKTVSRWENGNYMPGIEALSLLGRELGVSLNELVQGRRLEEGDFRAAADENLASALERPGSRFLRWLVRNHLWVVTVFLLCVLLAVVSGALLRYRAKHPGDTVAVGTYCTNPGPPGDGLYIVLQRDGEFYRYRQLGGPPEQGSWRADGPLVTITVGERSFQALIKESFLYVPDGEGRFTAYQKIHTVAMFINLGDRKGPPRKTRGA